MPKVVVNWIPLPLKRGANRSEDRPDSESCFDVVRRDVGGRLDRFIDCGGLVHDAITPVGNLRAL